MNNQDIDAVANMFAGADAQAAADAAAQAAANAAAQAAADAAAQAAANANANANAGQPPPQPAAAPAAQPAAGAGIAGAGIPPGQPQLQNVMQWWQNVQNLLQQAPPAVAAAAEIPAVAAAAPGVPAGAAAQANNNRARVKLSPFTSTNASDFREFRDRANTCRQLNGWTQQEAKQMIRTQMEGVAGKRMLTVVVGGDPDLVPPPDDAKTYEEYMDQVQLRFQHREASSLAIADFQKSRMRPDEDYLGWHVRLHDIHCLAYPNRDHDTDGDLIRQFILGLTDQVIADHLMERDPNNYEDCLAQAQSKQGKLAQVRQSMKARSRINTIAAIGPDGARYDDSDSDCINAINYETGTRKRTTTAQNKHLRRFGPGFNKEQRCSNCNKVDHATYDCPHNRDELAEIRRKAVRSKRANFGGARGNRRGRGNGRGGRGGRYANAKGRNVRKNQSRRGGAYAVGEEDYSDSIHALEDCLEQLAIDSRAGN